MKEVIVYETPSQSHYVLKIEHGVYKIFRNDGSAATRVGIVSFKNDDARAFSMAIKEADRQSAKVSK